MTSLHEQREPRRIAMVSVHGCPLVTPGMRFAGGMNVYLRDIAHAVAEKGVEIDVFTRSHRAGGPTMLDVGPGTRVIHLPAGDPELVKGEVVPYLPEYRDQLVNYVANEGRSYDVVHSHYWLSGTSGQELARRLGVPHAVSFHTLAAVKEREGVAEPGARRAMEDQMAATADLVFAFTDEEARSLGEFYDVPEERIHVAPGGVDRGMFRPGSRVGARNRLGLGREEKIVLLVGRPEPFKGPDILIRAAAEMRNTENLRLVLVGGSEVEHSFDWLRVLAADLGLSDRVSWFNAVPHEEIVDFYVAADLVAMPSFHESFGLTALEAMACGRPVIASAVGALPTLIAEGETGCLVPSHSPSDLARCLETLLANPRVMESMGRAGVERARGFTWGFAADQVLDGYRGLLG